MSVLARNVLMAHKRHAESNVVGKDWWLIHPHDWRHASWDVLVSILILITVITMPLSLGWEEISEDLNGMNLIIDILFMVDVVKNFVTGYIDENEFIVLDKRAVIRNYLTGYFMIDFLSSFPIDPMLEWYEASLDTGEAGGGGGKKYQVAQDVEADENGQAVQAAAAVENLQIHTDVRNLHGGKAPRAHH